MSKPKKEYTLEIQQVDGKWIKWKTYKSESSAKQGAKQFIKKYQIPLFADYYRYTKPRIIK